MKNSLLLFAVILLLSACKGKNDKTSSGQTDKKPVQSEYLLTKEGIGEIKIGMTRTELEKLLKQSLITKHANDTGDIWVDTAMAKYKEMEIMLYFQKQYTEEPSDELELYGVSANSPLCKTATGLGVGDDRNAVLAAYENNPITMGPENIMVNDTTWALSKTNYYIHVSDDMWDKQIVFLLVNKKVARLEATLRIGD